MNGRANLLTDVPGLRVGHAHEMRLASGVTVVLFDEPALAGVAVVGGGPAGRDQECLEPDRTVDRIDALALSGGSGFGLDAASGVQAWLRERGRGLEVGATRVPIVPSAVLFDLLNGGDKDWGRYPPYRELGYAACRAAHASLGGFALGSVGAGCGATTVNLKGGIGSASAGLPSGHTVAALAAVNAVGSAVLGQGPWFWAAPFEVEGEFGGHGWPDRLAPGHLAPIWKGGSVSSTTLAVVATDAILDKGQAKRLATIASTGLAKALRLSHAAMDGDTVFAASTLRRPLEPGPATFTALALAASDCVARAVARGVYEAARLDADMPVQSWRDLHG